MVALNPALHYLYRALAVAATIDGYTVPGDLYVVHPFDARHFDHAWG
jgi:hypothetical protein